jgi:beta-glucosidase
MKFRDTSLPINERVQDLIGQLTLKEKTGFLVMQNEAVERLGIPSFHWWSEALHGYARAGLATVFPQAIGLAAAWDPELLHTVGDIAATEGRAKYHEQLAQKGYSGMCHGLTIWSPNINIFRDPRWGRGQETYGEDPFLTAMMGNAFVQGLQGDDPKYLKTVATLKHYAVHSGPEPQRHHFDARTSEKDLRDTYLPAFEDGIRVGGAKSVMSAYSGYNGTPLPVNRRLLTEILRDEWGFDGAVVGDVDNVEDLYKKGCHNWAKTGAEAVAGAIKAGNELRSGGHPEHALEAVANGFLTEADIDKALTRLLILRFLLGQFDPQENVPWSGLKTDVITSHEHIKAAYDASRDSLVLLKNDGILPLKMDGIRKVAILGPTADDMDVLLGNYAGVPHEPVTILQGLKDRLEPLGVKILAEQNIPYTAGHSTAGHPIPPGVFFVDEAATQKGLTCRMYNSPDPVGKPAVESVENGPSLEWNTALPRPAQLTGDEVCVEWTGFMKVDAEGYYAFHFMGLGVTEMKIGANGEYLTIEWFRRKRHPGKRQIPLPGNSVLPVKITLRPIVATDAYLSLDWDPADGGVSLERTHKRAVAMAEEADLVILTLGLSHLLEGEEKGNSSEGFDRGDRTTIALPGTQQRLMEDVAKLGKPVVLLLSTGCAVSFDPNLVNAAMHTWYYGAQGGRAIADALFGVFSPAGRMPMTSYGSDKDLPPFEDYAMKGRTYRYFEGNPLFAFGHGLTYTSFDYKNLDVCKSEDGLKATLSVTNTGKVVSDDVVQVYASREVPGKGDPIRWLVGFERLRGIKPGETRNVELTLPRRWLALWSDASMTRVIAPGKMLLHAGPSSGNLPLCADVTF